MAQQTIQLPSNRNFGFSSGGFLGRNWIFSNNRPSIDDSLKNNSSDNRYLSSVAVRSDGQVRINLASSTSGSQNNADLSNAFEQNGGIDILYNGTTYSFELSGADTSEPYEWTPSNSSEVTTLYNALLSATDRGATLTIRDEALVVAKPDASAGTASVSINTIANGNEGTSVQLGATIIKRTGVYDVVRYAWTASSGTLSGANTATPTWTRPTVNADTNVTIRLTVTLEGDGTTAKDGTSVALAQVTRTARVLNVAPTLPAASAGTASVAIDSVSAGREGTRVTLGASVTKGTGVYDTVAYSWSVTGGTLTGANTSTPTWTRPQVSAATNYTITLTCTFSGNGGTARTGTSFTIRDTEVSSVTDTPPALPITSAGTASVSIDAVSNGKEGTAVDLSATVTKGTGVYDAVDYAWTVSHGTLTGAATATPRWTRSQVNANTQATIGLTVTLRGTGNTARTGTSVGLTRVTRQSTILDDPDVSLGNFNAVIGAVPAGVVGTEVELDIVNTPGNALYDELEYRWTVSAGTLDDRTLKAPTWTRPTTPQQCTINCRVTLQGTGTNAKSGTSAVFNATAVTAQVNPKAAATAPTATITAVPDGAEGTTRRLTATVEGGGYDDIAYKWEVSEGTLSDDTAQAPTWTRPQVSADTEVTIDLKVTVTGTGTNARADTSASVDAAQVTTNVLNVLPVASRGTTDFTITPVPSGEGTTEQQLGVTVTKGTGVYDSVSYLWTVGSGILDSRTRTDPTWTRPSVVLNTNINITLAITFSGDGTTARDETSFTVTKRVVSTVTPRAVVVTEIDLSDANFFDFGNSKTISYAVRPELVGDFVPSGQRRFLVNIGISATRFTLNMASSASGSDVRADLTNEFEKNGVIRFHISGTDYIIPMAGRDNSEPYRLNGPRTVLTALLAAFEGTGTMYFEFAGFKLAYSGLEFTKVNFRGNDYTKLVFNGQEY